jgi:UTP-glucose-1-phosphate uridylyltransferase
MDREEMIEKMKEEIIFNIKQCYRDIFLEIHHLNVNLEKHIWEMTKSNLDIYLENISHHSLAHTIEMALRNGYGHALDEMEDRISIIAKEKLKGLGYEF